MRTIFVGAWNVLFFSASMMLPRAASFSTGATESSRSKKTSSAGRPAALARNFGLEPGTDKHDRRARTCASSSLRQTSIFRRLAPDQNRSPILPFVELCCPIPPQCPIHNPVLCFFAMDLEDLAAVRAVVDQGTF